MLLANFNLKDTKLKFSNKNCFDNRGTFGNLLSVKYYLDINNDMDGGVLEYIQVCL